ncbi:MAG TPA: hypothetical protein VMM56_01335 [Planctomycetaceae bacterium]|nr:hypothetical protein [Planctomycetaceae bacterium]
MLNRSWIMPAFVICGLVSGCSHNATTLAENDPFHGKDPFQEVAAQQTTSDTSGIASVKVLPPQVATHSDAADGWRSSPQVTHPEFNYEPLPSESDSRVARITISNHSDHRSHKPGSSLQNAEYIVAKPASAEARIQIVSREELESEADPKFSVIDGIRFIETSGGTHERSELADDPTTSKARRESPPFVGETVESADRGQLEANPFEANPNPNGKKGPDRTPPQNTPEWWKS